MAKLPVYRTKDRCAGQRCPRCNRKKTSQTANELGLIHLDLLDYMRAILLNGDAGFLNISDATMHTDNKYYGAMDSRDTGKKYRAPVKLARTCVRVLEAFGLVDYIPLAKNQSGHKINEQGLDFLNGKVAVPKTSWTLDGGCLRQSPNATVNLVSIGFAPDPFRKVFLYP